MRFRVKLDTPEDMRPTARPLTRDIEAHSEHDAASISLDCWFREWTRPMPAKTLVLSVFRLLSDGSMEDRASLRRTWRPPEFERALSEWRILQTR